MRITSDMALARPLTEAICGARRDGTDYRRSTAPFGWIGTVATIMACLSRLTGRLVHYYVPL